MRPDSPAPQPPQDAHLVDRDVDDANALGPEYRQRITPIGQAFLSPKHLEPVVKPSIAVLGRMPTQQSVSLLQCWSDQGLDFAQEGSYDQPESSMALSPGVSTPPVSPVSNSPSQVIQPSRSQSPKNAGQSAPDSSLHHPAAALNPPPPLAESNDEIQPRRELAAEAPDLQQSERSPVQVSREARLPKPQQRSQQLQRQVKDSKSKILRSLQPPLPQHPHESQFIPQNSPVPPVQASAAQAKTTEPPSSVPATGIQPQLEQPASSVQPPTPQCRPAPFAQAPNLQAWQENPIQQAQIDPPSALSSTSIQKPDVQELDVQPKLEQSTQEPQVTAHPNSPASTVQRAGLQPTQGSASQTKTEQSAQDASITSQATFTSSGQEPILQPQLEQPTQKDSVTGSQDAAELATQLTGSQTQLQPLQNSPTPSTQEPGIQLEPRQPLDAQAATAQETSAPLIQASTQASQASSALAQPEQAIQSTPVSGPQDAAPLAQEPNLQAKLEQAAPKTQAAPRNLPKPPAQTTPIQAQSGQPASTPQATVSSKLPTASSVQGANIQAQLEHPAQAPQAANSQDLLALSSQPTDIQAKLQAKLAQPAAEAQPPSPGSTIQPASLQTKLEPSVSSNQAVTAQPTAGQIAHTTNIQTKPELISSGNSPQDSSTSSALEPALQPQLEQPAQKTEATGSQSVAQSSNAANGNEVRLKPFQDSPSPSAQEFGVHPQQEQSSLGIPTTAAQEVSKPSIQASREASTQAQAQESAQSAPANSSQNITAPFVEQPNLQAKVEETVQETQAAIPQPALEPQATNLQDLPAISSHAANIQAKPAQLLQGIQTPKSPESLTPSSQISSPQTEHGPSAPKQVAASFTQEPTLQAKLTQPALEAQNSLSASVAQTPSVQANFEESASDTQATAAQQVSAASIQRHKSTGLPSAGSSQHGVENEPRGIQASQDDVQLQREQPDPSISIAAVQEVSTPSIQAQVQELKTQAQSEQSIHNIQANQLQNLATPLADEPVLQAKAEPPTPETQAASSYSAEPPNQVAQEVLSQKVFASSGQAPKLQTQLDKPEPAQAATAENFSKTPIPTNGIQTKLNQPVSEAQAAAFQNWSASSNQKGVIQAKPDGSTAEAQPVEPISAAADAASAAESIQRVGGDHEISAANVQQAEPGATDVERVTQLLQRSENVKQQVQRTKSRILNSIQASSFDSSASSALSSNLQGPHSESYEEAHGNIEPSKLISSDISVASQSQQSIHREHNPVSSPTPEVEEFDNFSPAGVKELKGQFSSYGEIALSAESVGTGKPGSEGGSADLRQATPFVTPEPSEAATTQTQEANGVLQRALSKEGLPGGPSVNKAPGAVPKVQQQPAASSAQESANFLAANSWAVNASGTDSSPTWPETTSSKSADASERPEPTVSVLPPTESSSKLQAKDLSAAQSRFLPPLASTEMAPGSIATGAPVTQGPAPSTGGSPEVQASIRPDSESYASESTVAQLMAQGEVPPHPVSLASEMSVLQPMSAMKVMQPLAEEDEEPREPPQQPGHQESASDKRQAQQQRQEQQDKQLDLRSAHYLPPGVMSGVHGPTSPGLSDTAAAKAMMQETLQNKAKMKAMFESRQGQPVSKISAGEISDFAPKVMPPPVVKLQTKTAENKDDKDEKEIDGQSFERLAREVYHQLQQRLAVERERYGGYYRDRTRF